MSDIFISYSRTDIDWVAVLAKALEAHGYNVWWDPEILPGQDFEAVIQTALAKTKCIITVWSQASIQSHWVKDESSEGLNRGVLIPILYQQVKPPMPFGRIHTADLQDWKGNVEDASFQFLLRGIALHIEPVLAETLAPDKQPSEIDTVSTKNQQIKKQEAKQEIIAERYIDHGDGTISDIKTGLMWKKCCEGKSSDDCSQGKAERYTWYDAMDKFKNSHFADYNDWRLPTIEELRTLVYCSNGISAEEAKKYGCGGKKDKAGDYQHPTINQQVFPNTDATAVVWSSSPVANNADSAWIVGFYDGYDYWNYEDYNVQVRLVRSGQ
jgi:hypothetical protein